MSLLVSLWLCLPLSAQTPQDWRDSLSVLNQAIEREPSNLDLRLHKAAVNIQLNQWEYAVEEYSCVLKEAPENLAALYYRAYANGQLRQYGLARRDYEQFLMLVPRHLEARLGLALTDEKMGRERDARDEYNRIVELFPDSALAFAARAAFEVSRQQYEAALYDWEQATRLSPGNVEYAVSRADALLALGRKREAREALEALITKKAATRAQLREWLLKCK